MSSVKGVIMKELKNFARNLKELRMQSGSTQTDIAKSLGITYQSYQAYELGISVPTLQNFIKLAKLFDVSYDDLLN